MTSFLLVTIQAPLASWGEIAVGEWRGSWDRPSRSAIVGVLGAALGVLRNDPEKQRALAIGYAVAVRTDALGTPTQDYHTMQTVAKSHLKKRTIATRADILGLPDKETVLSRREYREGALYTVAIWGKPGAMWSLNEIADALRHPVFSLFAGRRANALGLPLQPSIVVAESLADAFHARPPLPTNVPPELHRLRPNTGWGQEVAHDECDEFPSGLVAPFRRVMRRDVPGDRLGWLFEERVVRVGTLPAKGGDA